MKMPLRRGITAVAVAVTLMNPFASFAASSVEVSGQFEQPNHYPHRTLLITSGILASGWALSSNSVATDKKRHFAISVLLGAGSEVALRRLSYTTNHRWRRVAIATGLATVPGVIKELSDSRFDTGDLVADIIGSFTGAMLSDLLQGPATQSFSVDVKSDKVTLDWAMRF